LLWLSHIEKEFPDMDVYDAILHKRAVRQFADSPLPQDVVEKILNAGRRSQSSRNTQPWHFIAIRDRETLQKLSTTGDYLGPVAGSALCIAIVTPNLKPEDSYWVAFDVGQAAAYMQLAAHEFRVGSVIGSVNRPDEAREVLGFPDDMRCNVVLSFGYPAPEEVRPLRGQGRKPFDEIVHWDQW
jgi:nitroreductase